MANKNDDQKKWFCLRNMRTGAEIRTQSAAKVLWKCMCGWKIVGIYDPFIR